MTIDVQPIEDSVNQPNQLAVIVQRISTVLQVIMEMHWRIWTKENRRRGPAKNFQRRW